MKILLVGRHTGWMGLHLAHFIKAFRAQNVEVAAVDFHRLQRLWGWLKVPDGRERGERGLEKLVKRYCPDVILFVAQWSFDLARLKTHFKGTVAVYDYDGPRRRTPEEYLALQENVDRFFTVSRWLQRQMQAHGKSAVYLPHGVDTDYYAPRSPSSGFAAPLSYIGRATPRRVRLCVPLQQYGLALYGARWSHTDVCCQSGLAASIRLNRDVRDEELVEIYSSSHAVLNILQEPLDAFRTILSIQDFAVPATAGCLLTEDVEELPEAFEPGKEVLNFRTPEELTELAGKCIREPDFARRIGEAGRRRCLAEHQWQYRVATLLQSL